MRSPAYGRILQDPIQDEEAEETASSTPLVPPKPPSTPLTETPTTKPPVVALKLVVLIAVTLQNTAYALARRYSRGHLRETYSTSSVLMVMEAAKLLLSMGMIVYAGAPSDVPSGSATSKYCFLLRHSQKMMVPAVVYLVMNILGFVVRPARQMVPGSQPPVRPPTAPERPPRLLTAVLWGPEGKPWPCGCRREVALWLSCLPNAAGVTGCGPRGRYTRLRPSCLQALGNIDAATFSIIAQMKVFTTATFSVLMLNRTLAPRKWRALCTLVVGVVLISHESMPKSLRLSGQQRSM